MPDELLTSPEPDVDAGLLARVQQRLKPLECRLVSLGDGFYRLVDTSTHRVLMDIDDVRQFAEANGVALAR